MKFTDFQNWVKDNQDKYNVTEEQWSKIVELGIHFQKYLKDAKDGILFPNKYSIHHCDEKYVVYDADLIDNWILRCMNQFDRNRPELWFDIWFKRNHSLQETVKKEEKE